MCFIFTASLVAQMVKNLPANAGDPRLILGQEVPLEKGMATTPVFLPAESRGQRSLVGHSLGLQRVGHD